MVSIDQIFYPTVEGLSIHYLRLFFRSLLVRVCVRSLRAQSSQKQSAIVEKILWSAVSFLVLLHLLFPGLGEKCAFAYAWAWARAGAGAGGSGRLPKKKGEFNAEGWVNKTNKEEADDTYARVTEDQKMPKSHHIYSSHPCFVYQSLFHGVHHPAPTS